MPNTRIRDKWEPIVKQIIADVGPRAGPTPILRELKRRGEELRDHGEQILSDYPSPRTIQRIKEDMRPEEVQEYQRFSWPDSMVRVGLPWEAAASALELLAHFHRLGLSRPPIHVVRWFWRVTQAAPDAPLGYRLKATRSLIFADWSDYFPPGSSITEKQRRGTEWLLAYAPWRSEENYEAYKTAIEGPESTAERVPAPGSKTIVPPTAYIPSEVLSTSEAFKLNGLGFSLVSCRVMSEQQEDANDEAQGK